MKNNDDYNFLYDEKLGKYGNMRKELLYRLKRDEYDELARSGELDKHCLYVEKEAHKMREKAYRDYERLGLQSFQLYDIAEDLIKGWIGYKKIEKL